MVNTNNIGQLRIKGEDGLSGDVFEIVSKAL